MHLVVNNTLLLFCQFQYTRDVFVFCEPSKCIPYIPYDGLIASRQKERLVELFTILGFRTFLGFTLHITGRIQMGMLPNVPAKFLLTL